MRVRMGLGVLFICAAFMTGCQQGKVEKPVKHEKAEKQETVIKEELQEIPEKGDKEVSGDKVKEEAEIVLPAPLSGLYKDMVVEKLEYQPQPENEKNVYITFDDGPCKSTPQLLDVLRKLNVKATFFVTAQYGSEEEIIEWLKQIKAEGHTAGVHSYSHRYDEIYSSVEKYLADFKKMDDLIVKATGEHARLFRFPGGSNTGYNDSVREEIIKEMASRGMVYYDWNAYNGDCDGFTKAQMIEKAVKESSYREKSIVLMHNIPKREQVIETIPSIVKRLREKGYEFKALDGTVEPIQFIKEGEVAKPYISRRIRKSH
ncbi:polysaccharide deacetylase family protein [[Clostridium] polysaccharolyticum]|uniref:Peptidoglycan/xylan/chitin deacetylase, PgdA/CDA1 family n=1 Tax=[Clostridium] polysaccharolyticum TaxID=29364 RepID=A0A1I0EHA2_9FIRM|nr:polysaccharide deacetylase family protein [[Clostridium] polysaccharolyticum]SET44470.1 Peptidoglycan/xylan/chitin deacetylase, PgdA/CDA1 family [[Clostridium] polysaccharolyticum]